MQFDQPRRAHGAQVFEGWDIDPTGYELTIWWTSSGPPSRPRVFVAEEHDAVHVLVASQRGDVASPGWTGGLPVVPMIQTVRLAAPLGSRTVVDAATDTPRPRNAPHAATHVALRSAAA